MQYHIFLGFLAVVAAYPGVIHEEAPQIEEKYDHHALIGESEHHHHVQHEHAKSHQSIKFEHFHPVPVYVKKEHSHLLKHPLEKGKHESNLKQIHPETEHSHGHGLVLEDHRFDTEHLAAALEHGGLEHHGGFEHHAALEGHGGLEGGLEHHGFEAAEGLKAYAEAPSSHEGYYAEHAHALSEDSGHGYGGY
ncbi:histidine-rich glycoprotein-like [Leguminivora glycinivorella]|uniref:histidine-rich glycoprotein-like n=1 Tax=Leguminivora glycinivorella TaxID=1035111 RepID=UPI00200FC5B4|nr:histidine-rich glycoprotein-like [Leguminivora glycinivorella]